LQGERAASQLLTGNGSIAKTFGDPVARRAILTRGELSSVITGASLARTRRLDRGAAPFRVVARAVTRNGQRAAVVAAQSLASRQASVHRLIVLLALAIPVAVIAMATAAWYVARRSLKPVSRITQTAATIGATSLDERVPDPCTRDEIAELAHTFNTMLDRVEHAVLGQRRLVADASHELRTPLAAMRSEIDVSLDADDLPPPAAAVLVSAREEVDHMTRTVDDLLTLAAVDEGVSIIVAQTTDLREVATTVVDRLTGWATERGVRLQLTAHDPAPILGDPEQLRRAAGNPVANAIRYSPSGETVRVSCTAGEDFAAIEVRDAGPGIPPQLRDRIFDRFFPADPSRGRTTGGSGLGLAITRHIAEAHGGRVSVRALTNGSAFVLSVPLVLARPADRMPDAIPRHPAHSA
jgi:heavy metal sensor kinase